jgi:hypothetical protein
MVYSPVEIYNFFKGISIPSGRQQVFLNITSQLASNVYD